MPRSAGAVSTARASRPANSSPPHGIALDSKGIYVGEVGVTNWKTSFPDTPMPPQVKAARCLQKLEKIQ